MAPQPLGAQLAKAERKARKASLRVKELEADLATEREARGVAEQSAADQHIAMSRQDHVHADEVAAIHAKLDRVLSAWAEILKRAQP